MMNGCFKFGGHATGAAEGRAPARPVVSCAKRVPVGAADVPADFVGVPVRSAGIPEDGREAVPPPASGRYYSRAPGAAEGCAPAQPFFPKRKHPVHLPIMNRDNRTDIIFVTVCAKDRRNILACSKAHQLLVAAWNHADEWSIGRYIIMPNHIHLFCAPTAWNGMSLRHWIGYWKSLATKHWHAPEEKPVWQAHFWDRQLRTGESYGRKWEYVKNNPVRDGLVEDATDWPYQGELNVLHWHD